MEELQGDDGEREKLNSKVMNDTLDILEELTIDASLMQEETKRWKVGYYLFHVKEKHFKNGNLV